MTIADRLSAEELEILIQVRTAELEKANRTQKELTSRYNQILEGINQILTNVVQAKTEEELANICLSVALKVTGSLIGFVSLIGADELLHDITINTGGWEQYLMYNKTGHRLPPENYVARSLYGCVINSGKSFFTNKPLSHPDSIGLPFRHPPVTSFLCVPLIIEGKTVGLIAVANHEGGYRCEQMEDLEAIAPIVVQALQRRRIEETLREANENLQVYSEELRVQSDELQESEARLREALNNLEEKVKERTIELNKTYMLSIENEKRFAEAQKMAHIGSWDWNTITDEVHFSDELYRIFGYSPQESNQYFGYIYNFVHPEDKNYVNNAIKKGLKGKPVSVDHRIILANGEEHTVNEQIEVIFDEKNIPIRMRGIVQDITERKRVEEKIKNLADVVESSDDAIITKSLDGIITSWNKGAQHIYGYSAEEILEKHISILEPAILKEEVKQLIERIKQGEKIHHYETLRLRKDGSIINVSISLSPNFDMQGKLAAISSIARDITTKKETEEKLIQEKQVSEVANRAKSEFLANMSHELRTPLNSIIGFSDLLHEQVYGELNKKQLRQVGNISRSGRHLLNLINDILDISKIEAGKLEPDYKNFDLASKLDTIRNIILPIADYKNIKIYIDIDSKLGSICADENKFAQIMYNLVDNAVKFSYENSLVKIEARKKGDLVEIMIKDTGIGIKAEDQNKLFKPFSQVDPFVSKRSQGTGLGLSLVKQLVHLHGGYVWFRSNLGEGSIFAFVIPLNNNKKNSGYIKFNQNI